jgi:hypothetical protein
MWTAWAMLGALIVSAAFLLRIAVHAGRVPSGIDTWYYLAYADAFRARPSFDVRLPHYLLQDDRQSYPPLFPMFLAMFPRSWLRRWFWTLSPAIDCFHLAILYWLSFKITASIPVAAISACVYAFTPQLISETRSLNPRSFGALLHSIAVVLAFRYVILSGGWMWLGLALLAGAALFLAAATSAAGYAFVCVVLSLLYGDWRYAAIAAGAFLLATALSGGHLLRVSRNYLQAVEFWHRNRRLFGAHPIRNSPIYGDVNAPVAERPGFLGGNTLQQLARLVGENPFVLALPLAPKGVPPWGIALYWWAMSLVALSLIATVLPPLRAFGPGRGYLKAGVFPTAYTLAVGIGTVHGLRLPVGIATVFGLVCSIGAISTFYLYSRRKLTEKNESVPRGLDDAVRHLAGLSGDGVLCLPYAYADYACYHSGKSVLWGSHCGDLGRVEPLLPVISEPIPGLLVRYGARYVLLDTLYARAAEIGLEGTLEMRGRWHTFELYEVSPSAIRERARQARASP